MSSQIYQSCLALCLTLVLLLPCSAQSQTCNCSSDLCCSRLGGCGLGDDYCGGGCQSGPCTSITTNTVVFGDVVNDSFVNRIINQAEDSCPGKGFYSRQAFFDAHRSFPWFGRVGSVDNSKRETAAFFAHVTLAIGPFCYIEQINGSSMNHCDETCTQYPCNPNKAYYGRGPIQLSGNCNYGEAGEIIGFDGLGAPETVATDPIVSFKTALWFWMNYCHNLIISGQGFGATIKAVNGEQECESRNTSTVIPLLVQYFTDYCGQLGVSTGDNLTC